MTTTSTNDPMVGHVLDGRYEILSRIARGGMATVYRAHDRRLTRTVAVKVMHDGLGDDAEFTRKFDREARAAAIVSNPHVVSVFDQGHDGGRPYIVMEFVEGFTLRHVISRDAPLDPLRALDLLEPVASALASAHDAGIVHRDIKPENVLISSRGHVKVTDFGLARAVSAQTATATQGMLMGTVSYLTPELVTVGRADSRGDIYSTGVVLFEMLTGRKPHTGDVPIQVAYMHVHNDIPAPSTQVAPAEGRREIPPYVDALVLACTRRTPTERPADGRELLGLLRRARKALAAGITDDPALTRDMWASVGRPMPDLSPEATTRPLATDSNAVANGSGAHAVANRTPRPGTATSRANPPRSSAAGAHAAPRTASGAASEPTPLRGTPRSRSDDRRPAGEQTARTSRTDPRLHTSTEPGLRTHTDPGLRTHTDPHLRSHTTPLEISRGSAPWGDASLRRQRQAGRRRRALAVLVTLTLLVLALLIGVHAYSRAQAVTEPSLANLTRPDAEAALSANHLAGDFKSEYSETVPKGSVIRTDPAAGASVRKDSKVTAWLSLGPERHAVPQLVGLTQDAATKALASASLAVGTVTTTYSESVPQGTVVAVSQNPGTLMKRGGTVNLDVSKGRRPITIPSVVNQSLASATTTLQNLGFTVTSTDQNSATVPAGQVVSQTPRSGTGHRGDTIQLVRSLGPVMVSVPDVRLRTEQGARDRLTAAGFQVKVIYPTASWLRVNFVAGQSPSSGKQPQGSTVTIWVD